MEKYSHSEPYITYMNTQHMQRWLSRSYNYVHHYILGMLLVYKRIAQPELAVCFVVELRIAILQISEATTTR